MPLCRFQIQLARIILFTSFFAVGLVSAEKSIEVKEAKGGFEKDK